MTSHIVMISPNTSNDELRTCGLDSRAWFNNHGGSVADVVYAIVTIFCSLSFCFSVQRTQPVAGSRHRPFLTSSLTEYNAIVLSVSAP